MSVLLLSAFILFHALLASAVKSVPPATLKDQTYNWPQAELPSTPGVLPGFNVPLQPGATNIVDLTFGTNTTGSTIQSVDQLGNVAYFYDLFGDPEKPRTPPGDGIPGNFLGIYSFYNEYLPNSTVRNPLAVHQVLEDRLRLVARTAMNGSAPGAKYEIGYIRLPTEFKPGMLAEITLAPGGWPTCRWSWPTFWAFSGVQEQNAPWNLTRWYGHPPLEIDGFDGFPKDNTTQGVRIPNGAIIYGSAEQYDYPYDEYLQTTGSFRYENSIGITWLDTTPETIPTNASNPGLTVCMDWTDINTIKWIYNGEVAKIHHVYYPAVYSNATNGWDGSPPPSNLIGEPVPLFIMISHQFGVESNPVDGKALDKHNGSIFAAYDIKSIRVWDKPSTALPPSSTPNPGTLPPPRTGSSLGDLPYISTGTYVLNVEAVNGEVIDHYGGQVTLLGDAVLGSDTINGLPATSTTNFGGISTVMGGISVQKSDALYWAQAKANIYLFQVAEDTEGATWYNSGTWAQFIQLYPASQYQFNKTSLVMTPYRQMQAFVSNNVTNSTVATAAWSISLGKPSLATLVQTVGADGVSLAVGVGSSNVTAAGRVPASAFTGFTELLIGSGRDQFGMMQNGAQFFHGQTLIVATPINTTLSVTDTAIIQAYFVKKWGVDLEVKSVKSIKIN